jgi:hypothetical protein
MANIRVTGLEIDWQDITSFGDRPGSDFAMGKAMALGSLAIESGEMSFESALTNAETAMLYQLVRRIAERIAYEMHEVPRAD